MTKGRQRGFLQTENLLCNRENSDKYQENIFIDYIPEKLLISKIYNNPNTLADQFNKCPVFLSQGWEYVQGVPNTGHSFKNHIGIWGGGRTNFCAVD